jgi:hypothetical protein
LLWAPVQGSRRPVGPAGGGCADLGGQASAAGPSTQVTAGGRIVPEAT